MVQLNYGKYSIPEELHAVIALKQRLHENGSLPYGDLIGYYFDYELVQNRYLNTPLDVIPFARSGMDGIHYGFLTDFGQVPHLRQAYIVRISPMDFDHPVKIVARNLHDFLTLICYYPNAVDLLDMYTSKDITLQFLKQYPMRSLNDIAENHILQFFKQTLKLEPLENLLNYFKQLHNDRIAKIVIPTKDGIGIVYPCDSPNHISIDFEEPIILSEFKLIFEQAPFITRLICLRELQSKGLIFDNAPLKMYLRQQLHKMQLHDEAVRIEYPK